VSLQQTADLFFNKQRNMLLKGPLGFFFNA